MLARRESKRFSRSRSRVNARDSTNQHVVCQFHSRTPKCVIGIWSQFYFFQMYMIKPATLLTAFLLLLLTAVTGTAQEGKLEQPTKLYMGLVTADDGSTVDGGKIYVFEDPYPNVVTSSKINSGDGYKIYLDPEKIYIFRIEAPGFYTQEFIISTPTGPEYIEVTEHFEIHPIPIDTTLYAGAPFVGDTPEFEGEALQGMIEFLKENPTVEVTIAVGLVENAVDAVSKARVAAIKDLFTKNELSLTRITWFRDLESPFNSFAIRVTGFNGSK